MERRFRLFGTRQQTALLILLHLLDESYPRELSRLSGGSLKSVQNTVAKLEDSGVLATRLVGAERWVTFSPRFAARGELRALLARLAEGEPEIAAAAASLRRRPRKQGKEI